MVEQEVARERTKEADPNAPGVSLFCLVHVLAISYEFIRYIL